LIEIVNGLVFKAQNINNKPIIMGTSDAGTARARKPSKRRRRKPEESRTAIVHATLRAMSKGEALTSGGIARAAGLAQPTFYAYFKTVEEARLAAAKVAAERLAGLDDERRKRFAEHPDDLAATAEALESWLSEILVTGPLWDALAPYAREASTLGGMVRAVVLSTRARLADDLFAQARRFGVGPEHYPVFVQLAETMNASTAATGRMLVAGHLTDVRAAAWVLARSFFAAMKANIIACGGCAPPWD
jgi:AcrR family transcriptional regulator